MCVIAFRCVIASKSVWNIVTVGHTTWRSGLEIYISRQWTIGPPHVLEIWLSCQVYGSPYMYVANRQYLFVKSNTADRIDVLLFKGFEQSLQYMKASGEFSSRRPDHHIALSGGPTGQVSTTGATVPP